MKAGKLPGVVEERSVFMFPGGKGMEPAEVARGTGADGRFMAAATDQTGIFGTEQTQALRVGMLFDRVCAKLAAQGARAEVFNASLSLPPAASEASLKKLAALVAQAAKRRDITAYSVQVQTRYEPEGGAGAVQLVLTGAGSAKGAEDFPGILGYALSRAGDLKPDPSGRTPLKLPAGDNALSVVMAGYAALEATAVLISEKQESLSGRLAASYLAQGLKKASRTDVREAARIAAQAGALAKIAGEGGVFGALWEIGEYFDCGMDIILRDILLLQETIEVCEILDVNPYLLASGGCLLAVTGDAQALLARYRDAGIAAAAIGILKEGRDRVIHNEWEERFLEPFRAEELYRVL